jgi:DNA-binding GntR family transcriptional regulator
MPTDLRTVSVVDAVAEELSKAILSGEIVPGTPVSEAALSERFGVPRPTVRSALLLVMRDGLLRREPNRSVYVPVLSDHDVIDLFSVRHLIEFDTITKLVEGKVYPTAAMRTLRVLEALEEDECWDEVVRLDFALHQQLIDAVDSPRLSRIYSSISAETRLALTQLRAISSPAIIAAEHRELMDAICSYDLDAAIAVARVHIDESRDLILDLMKANAGANVTAEDS